MAKRIGYLRVSSLDQKTDRQLEGVKLDKVFTEKISGKSMDRPQLIAMMDYVREDDHVHVHELSRLGRSVIDLHKIVDRLLEKGVGVTFTKEDMTFIPGKDADPFQELMFGMLASFSQFERSLIKQRQKEGIAAAKAKGKHLGRRAILTNLQKAEIVKKKAAGSNPTALAKEYGVSRATVYNVIKENH